MKFIVIAILATVALSGCKTMSRSEALASYRATCAEYGFAQGTDANASCVMQLEQNKADRDARSDAVIGAMGMELIRSGSPRVQQSTITTCNYTGSYGMVRQTCY